MRVAVIGGGAWGTTVANLVARQHGEATLWARDNDVVDDINNHNRNTKFLPDAKLSINLFATSQVDQALDKKDLVFWAIPVQYMRPRLRTLKSYLDKSQTVINLSKGFEMGSLCRPSEIIRQECPNLRAIGSLGGPNIAKEIIRGKYATAALAMERHWENLHVKEVFESKRFSVALCPDLISLETAGAIKNIIAIGAGICDGMSLGINTKSIVVSKGFEELKEVVIALGGNPDALKGVFGMADVLTTCFSESSRNRTLGQRLGEGFDLKKSEASLSGRVAEGLSTCIAWKELASKLPLCCPILDAVSSVVSDVGKINEFEQSVCI